ncbi:MAG: glycosyltransferase [Planctomycetaceae bacterium]
MTRIVFVIPTLDRSGAEKQLMLLATGLPRDEFDVRVIALTRGGSYAQELQAAGIPVTVLGKRLRFDPLAAWQLRKELQRTEPDIVHSWLFAANAYTRLAMARSLDGPKVVVSERCVDVWKAGWQLSLDRKLISRTDQLIGNSQAVERFYNDLGYPASHTCVIHNAVTTPIGPVFSRSEFLRQLGYPDDVKLVAYVGRLAPQKRVSDLIWAAQLLRQADSRTRLLIVGDGPERDQLIHYAKQAEAADYVRFLGHREDAASLLHLVDVFWLASDFEGLSNSLMEAMACGKPIVVSDIPPNRELVDHSVQGYRANIGDSVAFAQFTRKLFDDPALTARLGAAGRDRMTRDFSLAAMVEKHIRLYRQLMGTTSTVVNDSQPAAAASPNGSPFTSLGS